MDNTIERLYEELHTELVNWCCKMTMDESEAEELVQEGFVRAILHEQKLLGLKFNQQRAYMYKTIKRIFIDKYRRGKFETATDKMLDISISEAHYSDYEWEQILDSLPDLEGAIFMMRYVHDLNSKQIGDLLKIPPGTVRSKLSSARKHLRELL